jgi:enoyl-[acyl-carrier-protein] reductase (NADH)
MADVRFRAQRRGVSEHDVVDEIASAIALETIPTDDDVAHAAAALVSPRSSATRGQALDVTGGEDVG